MLKPWRRVNMPKFESYQRVFVKHALDIVSSRNTTAFDDAKLALAQAQPYIVAFLRFENPHQRPSDHKADQMIVAFNDLVPCPTTLMLRSRYGAPHRNVATTVRKLLSAVALACNWCDVALQYQRFYNTPLEDALRKTSFRYCSQPLMWDATADTAPNSDSPDGLDNKAVGIIRHLGEDCLRHYGGISQPCVVSSPHLVDYVAQVLRQLYPPL